MNENQNPKTKPKTVKSDSKQGALYLINKPAGHTSFDCIRLLKKILNTRDLGHGGTLDKFATGLLPVFRSEGLKLSRFFTESWPDLSTYWKTYTGTIKLGLETDTGDPEGAVVKEAPVRKYQNSEIINIMNSFISSEYWQMPPVFSAKKFDGKRASDLTRAGTPPVMSPSLVVIKSFEMLEFNGFDKISFKVECSKGTYIRSLVKDLASRLETCGMLETLTRTQVGSFRIEDSFYPSANSTEEELNTCALDLLSATNFIPTIEVNETLRDEIIKGKKNGAITHIKSLGLNTGAYRLIYKDIPLALFQILQDNEIIMLRGFNN